ncbi:MAG: choice-of-anchor D domain-containing protein [Dissulfurispiraceae bacterium]
MLSSDGLINCGSNCSEDYLSGTALTLTATPYANSLFTGWSGGGCTGTGSCQLTMSQGQTVTASFANNSPIISVSPASLDFGNVRLNKSLSKTVSINNTGSANLIVTGVEITGSASSQFLAKWTKTQTIRPSGAYSLRITFRPVSSGSQVAAVTIHSNDPVTPVTQASLKGVGK